MTVAAEAPPAPAPGRSVRIALIVIAAIEAAGALKDIPAIFYDYNPETPLGKLAQNLGSLDHILAVPITLAALYFAAAGHLRYAIMAIALRILVTWLTDTPTSLALHGIEWSFNYGGLNVAGYQIGAPLIGLGAIWLAWRNEKLWLGASLVALPTLFYWIGVLIFTVAIMIYGF